MCRTLFYLISIVLMLSVVHPASAQPTGYILFEYWFDIGGTAVSDLTGNTAYPGNPNESEWRQNYEGPVDWKDNYGSRARGFLYPPADGDYTFWISGDDFVELYLSTDDDPANATLIAQVPSWTQHLEWGKYPEQQSAPVTLVGGQKYYIESIMKEAGGGDSMTVAWAGPGIGEELTIIDGAYLSPLIRGDDDPLLKIGSRGNIIWVSGFYDDNADGVPDDQEWVDILTAKGYNVDYTPGWEELDDAKIAALNAADLIIVSRNSSSGDFDDGDEVAQWNAITTPIILSSPHIARSSRWGWVDSASIVNIAPAVMELTDGPVVSAIDETVGPSSFIDTAPGNGAIFARGDGLPFIIEWEAGVEYYAGSGQTSGGPRMFFVAGTQDTAPVIGRGEMNLTPEGLGIFLEAVDILISDVRPDIGDITVPGDIVRGIPDDGDWPGAEHPALAIDDNVGTKYLHFKGETETTGIKVTPLDGPSLVTGLAFTTANNAAPRDPVAFELYGSNDSIDGPFTLIASGDIVDFAGADAWPRFTKNETAITFDNDKLYAHYQVLFPAVRDAGSANSMQIAEVELLGTVERDEGIVDDFENYNVFDEAIFKTWIDGTVNPIYGGSELSPTTEHIIPQGGFDSGKVLINNTILSYSEIHQTFDEPRNWTEEGDNVLSVYVRGDSQNTDNFVAPIYIRIGDYVLYYYNQFSFNTEGWTELIFPFEDFADIGVNLTETEVSEMAIGIGMHPNTVINHPSIEPLQFDPQSIRPLQVNTCNYCSYNGVVYFDEITLKTLAVYLEGRSVLTGCVFDGGAPVENAVVSLSPNAGSGDPLTDTTCTEGRYLMYPVVGGWNVTVTKEDGDKIYSGSLTNLQKGFNEVNFSPP